MFHYYQKQLLFRGVLFFVLGVFSTQSYAFSKIGIDDGQVTVVDGLPCFYAPASIKSIKVERLNLPTKVVAWEANYKDFSAKKGSNPKVCIKYGDNTELVETFPAESFQYNVAYQVILGDWDVKNYNSGGSGRHIVSFCLVKNKSGVMLTREKESSSNAMISECTNKPLNDDKPPSLWEMIFG